jgi:hypothetical protein
MALVVAALWAAIANKPRACGYFVGASSVVVGVAISLAIVMMP